MDNRQPAVSLATLLLVAFVVLKLCHVIDWSWWWVLAPAWVPVALTLLLIAGVLVVGGVAILVAFVVSLFKRGRP